MAMIDIALTMRVKIPTDGNPASAGAISFTKKMTKKPKKTSSTILRPTDNGDGGLASEAPGRGEVSGAGFSLSTTAPDCGRKTGSFSRILTAVNPVIWAMTVATIEVPIMAVGLFPPAAARMAIAVTGISWMEAVLTVKKVHIALVAVPGIGLSFCKSAMARRPSGVAALRRPSMLAAIFMTIEPIAGCSGGTSGKSQ